MEKSSPFIRIVSIILAILDLGCGFGIVAFAARVNQGNQDLHDRAQIVGLDVSTEAITAAKDLNENNFLLGKFAGSDNISFKYGKMTNVPLANSSVNVVTAIESLSYLPPTLRRKALKEVRRVLSPGAS